MDFPPAPVAPPQWYPFTAKEQQTLRERGCRFDPAGKLAKRMRRRGFTKAEILQACRDVRRFGGGDSSHLEPLASFRRSGLPLSSYAAYRRSGRTITGWYNRTHMGGRKVLTTAWILFGVSLVSAQIAAILALLVHPIDRLCCGIKKTLNDDWDINCRQKFGPQSRYFKPFLGLLGAGSFFALLGLPVVTVGVARVRRWLSGDVLDTGHVRDLDRFRLRYLNGRGRPRVRASVAPQFTRGGAGVGLTLRW